MVCCTCQALKQMTATKQIFSRGSYVSFCAIRRFLHSVKIPISDSGTPGKSVNLRTMTIDTGKYARFADGSATAQLGDTTVLVTVTGKQLPVKPPFMAMTVDYRHKSAAAGYIPRNFKRRELGPTDGEILISRMIDRSLRPLFPKECWFELSLSCNLFALDSENDPDILAINAASAALSLSQIPWHGPIGAVRMGYVNGKFVVNPTRKQLKNSSLDLIVVGASDNRIIMLEASANIFPYDKFEDGILMGLEHTQHIVSEIEKLQKRAGKKKIEFEEKPENTELYDLVASFARATLQAIFMNKSHDKISRDNAVRDLRFETRNSLSSRKGLRSVNADLWSQSKFFWQGVSEPEKPDVCEHKINIYQLQTLAFDPVYSKEVEEMFDRIFRETFRDMILETSLRCDGRSWDWFRPISIEAGLLRPLHGSAFFQRGQTQVLCSVTLDSMELAAKMDDMSQMIKGLKSKNFMLHYEFPPYAVNEMPSKSSVSRREIGHGNLAERGLKPVIPEKYNFTIRLTSEVLESNGSSSMASVCGGSLALMDAGVPIVDMAAGVAIGLVTRQKKDSNEMDYAILTDLLGIEDYLGDMDFKIAGTEKGITALQADIKIQGLSTKMIKSIMMKGKDAVAIMLSKMKGYSKYHREDRGPKTEILEVPIHQRARFVGPSGINLKRIENETGVKITLLDETSFSIFAPNQKVMVEAKAMIKEVLEKEREPELEFNSIYTLKVVEVLPGGVKAQIDPRIPPFFLPNSKLQKRKVSHGKASGFEVGDEFEAVYYGRDPVTGTARFSRLGLIPASFTKTSLPTTDKTPRKH